MIGSGRASSAVTWVARVRAGVDGGNPAGVVAVAAVAIIPFLYPPVWSVADDTPVLREASMGLAALFEPHASYQILIERAFSLVEGPNPLLIGALASYAVTAAIALFLAWRVNPIVVPALVLAPAYSVYGTLTNAQWILAVYLVAMLVATPPTSTKGRVADAFGLLAAGLTGPFSVFFLPLYVIRARNPVWRWHLFFVGCAAAIQVMTMLSQVRLPAPAHDTLAVMLARDGLPVAIIAVAGLRYPRLALGALYVAVLIPFLGVNATYHMTGELLAGDGQRYFYLPWVVAIGLGLWALDHRRQGERPLRRGLEGDVALNGVLAVPAVAE